MEPGLISEFIKAYDAFFPALSAGDQANVVPVLNWQGPANTANPQE